MIPYAPDAAQVLLLAAMALHGLLAGLVVVVLLRGPAEQRVVTPVWHLTFVGFVLVPLVAAPLGWIALSQAIALVTGAAALAILGASALQLLRRRVPAPLRPLLAIHLAPVSVLGAVAVHLGQPLLAQALGWLALGLVAALLLRLRALLEAGFSPLWGAFTFPLAAFTNLMLLLAAAHPLWLVPGGLGLASATLAIPAIALRVVRLWADGTLALKTNAAVA
jgi:tellurite resistance protein